MRRKVVIRVLAFGALFFAGLSLREQFLTSRQPQANAEISPASAPHAETSSPSATANIPNPAALPAKPSPALSPEQKQENIVKERERLQELCTKDDPASLAAILDDLTNPEKEIRLAAIEAAKQFGSKDAISALEAAAAASQDIHEQIAFLEAADFLSLPTIADPEVQIPRTPDEIAAAQQRRAQLAAMKQARLQQRGLIQNTTVPANAPPPADPNAAPAAQ